jgi:hypothetical protein
MNTIEDIVIWHLPPFGATRRILVHGSVENRF